MNGSEIQAWEGTALLKACRSPFLRTRFESWIKATRSAGAAPLLKDLYGSDEETCLEKAMLLMQNGTDFIYVHQGSTSVREYGRLFRGSQLSSMTGSLITSLRRHYNSTFLEMTPKYMQFRTDFSARHIRWERLALPLVSDENESVKFLLIYSESMDDKIDILQSAFDRSSVGMVAAAKAIGEDRPLEEADILLINARAKSMLKLPDDAPQLLRVSDMRDWVTNTRKWTLVCPPKATSGHTIISYRDESESKDITVVVEPIEHFVIFHIID